MARRLRLARQLAGPDKGRVLRLFDRVRRDVLRVLSVPGASAGVATAARAASSRDYGHLGLFGEDHDSFESPFDGPSPFADRDGDAIGRDYASVWRHPPLREWAGRHGFAPNYHRRPASGAFGACFYAVGGGLVCKVTAHHQDAYVAEMVRRAGVVDTVVATSFCRALRTAQVIQKELAPLDEIDRAFRAAGTMVGDLIDLLAARESPKSIGRPETWDAYRTPDPLGKAYQRSGLVRPEDFAAARPIVALAMGVIEHVYRETGLLVSDMKAGNLGRTEDGRVVPIDWGMAYRADPQPLPEVEWVD